MSRHHCALQHCRVPDLARLYVLCARIQALEPLRVAFRDYIGRTGLALVLDEEKVLHSASPRKQVVKFVACKFRSTRSTLLHTVRKSCPATRVPSLGFLSPDMLLWSDRFLTMEPVIAA